jgi:hypothetical protein
MTVAAPSRNAPVAVTAALILVGIVLAGLGVIYYTRTAGQLPPFLPGHQAGSAHHHLKHGLVAFALALLAWITAWFTTGKRARHGAS